MQYKNAEKPNTKKSLAVIVLTALARLGNMVILAVGAVYFGIRKLFFMIIKKKDSQTLEQFIKKLEAYLEESSLNIESVRKPAALKAPGKTAKMEPVKKTASTEPAGKTGNMDSTVKSASFAPGLKKELSSRLQPDKPHGKKARVSILPVRRRPLKNTVRKKKTARRSSRWIYVLRLGALAAAAGAIVFAIILSINGFGSRNALAERNNPAVGTDVLENPFLPEEIAPTVSPAGGMLSAGILEEPSEGTDESLPQPSISPGNTPEQTAEPELDTELMIHIDDTYDIVASIQEKLMELHYMDNDEPTTFYGPVTQYAMQLFQRGHGLSVDGVAGHATLTLLFSDDAKPYLVRKGDKGTDIAKIQERLCELGYLDSKNRDGRFDADTDYAVRVFQGRNKLSQDGIVGHHTTQVLFNGDAKPARTSSSGGSGSGGSTSGGSTSGGGSSGGSSGGSYNANDAASFVAFAKTMMGRGIPYVYGGKTTSGFDCSGYVYYCLKQTGNNIGYKTSSAWAESSYSTISSMSDVKPGDILCFKGHVGIYIGDGKMIDASSSQNGIRITNVKSSDYWNRNWICGKRVFS